MAQVERVPQIGDVVTGIGGFKYYINYIDRKNNVLTFGEKDHPGAVIVDMKRLRYAPEREGFVLDKPAPETEYSLQKEVEEAEVGVIQAAVDCFESPEGITMAEGTELIANLKLAVGILKYVRSKS